MIVSPNDYQQVIPTVDPSVATLTLTSCHPKFSARQRIVVKATLDPTRSDQVTAAYVPSADETPAPAVIPGDDVTATTQPAEAAAVTVPSTNDAAPTDSAAATGGDVPTDDGSIDTAADLDATADAGQDLFENSWFSDPDAFPQVALWGVALTLVALGATALSRRVRRNWVGALVGIVPFIVVLYFWFENVNRLLPPNL